MTADLIDTLPLPHRLALSYAPARSRNAALAVLALDARLAGIVRADGEPVIAQLKLAWWRDRLQQDPAEWPAGEPLLALLRDAVPQQEGLHALVDGWESLLGEQLDRAAIEAFAAGRMAAWRVLDDSPATAAVAREWALFDLARNLGQQAERDAAMALVRAEAWETTRLPRHLRPLAVLHGLSRRALRRDNDDLLDGPGAMLAAMRLGILGR